ncbi:aspartate--tRNA ligase [bacterium]|nr:aspartate--tRNA ligase [FCB group bacterium]MBL7191801.1 aspartate--tRNA ligase [bacterium]
MLRTKRCGDIDSNITGQTVILTGWLQRTRDLGGLLFLDLRDRYGLVQIVINPDSDRELADSARKISRESVIKIEGLVQPRPPEMINKEMKTGEVEIKPFKIEVLSHCAELPIPFEEIIDAGEELRLKYRYLELRRPGMQKMLEMRHRLAQSVRRFLDDNGFWEVETPFLMRSTPEGARDFLVPSRIYKGRFYALPQSPQTYKQLLMVSGIDRYFQIVKCFRDEDFRADRQPEFTQIDLEMSFIEEEDIFSLVERMMRKICQYLLNVELDIPFPRLTYQDAANQYGCDKPDIRFDLTISDVSDKFTNCGFGIFENALKAGGTVKALPAPELNFSRKQIDGINETARKFGLPGVVVSNWDGETWSNPIGKYIEKNIGAELGKLLLNDSKGAVLFAAGDKVITTSGLGQLRLWLAEEYKIPQKSGLHFLWVTDFPLFERDTEGNIASSHHPFTAPVESDTEMIDSDPLKVRSRAYDLILNGYEIASGSIRIHNRKLQERIFSRLGLSDTEAQEKFGFLLNAFDYGVPPHGGIAFGFDRILMLLSGKNSIREVIPFPKTTSGLSLMDNSPAPVDQKQLEELGISILKKKSK